MNLLLVLCLLFAQIPTLPPEITEPVREVIDFVIPAQEPEPAPGPAPQPSPRPAPAPATSPASGSSAPAQGPISRPQAQTGDAPLASIPERDTMEPDTTESPEPTPESPIRDEEGNLRWQFMLAGALLGTLTLIMIYIFGFRQHSEDERAFLFGLLNRKAEDEQ